MKKEKKQSTLISKRLRYIHIAKAASLLGCSEQYVRSRCASGELVATIIGGAWHAEENALESFLRNKIKSKEVRASALAGENREMQTLLRDKFKNVLVVGREIRRKT